MAKSTLLSEYSYDLPEELLASEPAEPRHSSRLFVYDTATNLITTDVFANLTVHLPDSPLLVFNDTRVVPARAQLKKETGGRVECLFLVNELKPGDSAVKVLADRKLTVGQKLNAASGHEFLVVSQDENIFSLQPAFSIEGLSEFLTGNGTTPVPKYLGQSGLTEAGLRKRYQSIFARRPASIAAPTASLHFTPEVLQDIEKQGGERAFVSLHVGMGTFAPITQDNLSENKLHKEMFRIGAHDRAMIREAKRTGRKVVAVGTTTVRALESSADRILSDEEGELSGETDIFIRKPFGFRIPDALLTNFHLPQSSLMCLVDAFLDHKSSKRGILSLYKTAIEEKLRFYSFGDSMLIK